MLQHYENKMSDVSKVARITTMHDIRRNPLPSLNKCKQRNPIQYNLHLRCTHLLKRNAGF